MTVKGPSTFSATAVRFVRQKSSRIFQEAIEIFHDREFLEATVASYAADGMLAFEYAMHDQPVHGPMRVYSKTISSRLDGAEAIDALFGVNRSPYLYARANSKEARSPRPEPEIWEPELLPKEARFDRYLTEIATGLAWQKSSYVAPRSLDKNHPWWDLNELRNWIAVRFFASDGSGGYLEQLDIIGQRVTVDSWPLSADTALDLASVHAAARAKEYSMSVLAVEAMNCAVKLNGNPLFKISRSSRFTPHEYLAAYVV